MALASRRASSAFSAPPSGDCPAWMRLIMAAAHSAERDDIESLLADDAIAVSDGGVAQRLGQPLRQ